MPGSQGAFLALGSSGLPLVWGKGAERHMISKVNPRPPIVHRAKVGYIDPQGR